MAYASHTISLLTLCSSRRIDIRLLPSLVPEELRNETAQIIEPELRARIDKLKGLIDDGVIDSDSSSNGMSLCKYCRELFLDFAVTDEGAKVSCQFTLHAQIHPVPVPDYLMQALENELQNPTGITTVPAPKLSISALLVSKECGIMYEMKNTEGLRYYFSFAPFSGLMNKLLPGHGCFSAKSQLVSFSLASKTGRALISFYRRWIDCRCLFIDSRPFCSSDGSQPDSFWDIACFPLDLFDPGNHGFCVICWSYHVCYTCRGSTVLISNSAGVFSLHSIYPRSCMPSKFTDLVAGLTSFAKITAICSLGSPNTRS